MLSKSRLFLQPNLFAGTKKPVWRSLVGIISEEKYHLGGAAIALTATSGGTLAFPYFTGKLMDGFAESVHSPEMWVDLVNTNAVACIGALSIIGLGGFVRSYLLETASEKISRRLRLQLFERLLKKPVAYYDTINTGDLVSRLGTDVTRVSRSIMDAAFGFRVLINAVAGTGLVANFVPVAIIPQLLAPVAIMFIGGVLYGRFVRSISRKSAQAQAKSMEIAQENLSLIRLVKLFNGRETATQEYLSSLDEVYGLAQSNALATGGRVAAFVTIGGGFILHVIYQCGLLISTGTLSIGQTSALAGYLLVCGNSYQGLITAYGEIQKALGACSRIVDTAPMTRLLYSSLGDIVCVDRPEIEFKNVSFKYGDRTVLNGINLTIPSGARQAIVGLSGCGKSSLLLLLAKLYEPSEGSVRIGANMLEGLDPELVRDKYISMVPQDTALFNRSIRANISYPNKVLLDDELSNLKNAARLEFVSDWDASVGERGQGLSGGERQRIALARALARKSPVLLLDEATSALDRESDGIILSHLANEPRTIVAVTHRMSAIEWSDRLAVIDEGRVVQSGNTKDLLRNPGPVLQRLLAQLDTTDNNKT